MASSASWKSKSWDEMTENERAVKLINDAGMEGYDLTAHSKCKRPEYFGLRRTPKADRALTAPAQKPRKDTRKLMRRMYFRLEENEYTALARGFEMSNCKTWQEYLREMVQERIEELRRNSKTASDAETSKAAPKKTN